jgi:DUF4097 and DUF4098 domain-containing protein YvlB
MRPRSITGPLILVAIGVLFLINNLHPEFSPFSLISDYWPFLLIGAGAIGLVEVLYHASRGVTPPPRPIGGGWIFWIVIWCLIVPGVFSSHSIHFRGLDTGSVSLLGSDYDYDIASAGSPQVASQGVTHIVLDNIRGNVTVKGDESGDVKVSGHKSIRAYNHQSADRANQDSRITVERKGDAVVIALAEPSNSNRLQISTDLDVSIPKGLSVEAHGRTGDLTIDNVDGMVDLSTARGDIRLTHIGKNVRIDASRSGTIRATDLRGGFDLQGKGSDVQLENIAGEVSINGDYSGTLEFHALAKPLRFESSRTEFHVEAVPGTITLDLGQLKLANVTGPVRFSTGTRDIDASDVTGALDLAVERGDITVKQNAVPIPKIDVRSHNGDISLLLPEKAGFDLKGTTAQGEVENGYGAALTTQSTGRSSSILGQVGTGPTINVVTDRGTVSVKKL